VASRPTAHETMRFDQAPVGERNPLERT
jgi:hypothetical protein